jgi:hypothetical protein
MSMRSATNSDLTQTGYPTRICPFHLSQCSEEYIRNIFESISDIEAIVTVNLKRRLTDLERLGRPLPVSKYLPPYLHFWLMIVGSREQPVHAILAAHK